MRRVVLILLLLLAGAVVNVAVAWGCALAYHDRTFYPMGHASELDRKWWYSRTEFPHNVRPVEIGVFEGIGLTGTLFVRHSRDLSGRLQPLRPTARIGGGASAFRSENEFTRLRCGWPLRSLEGSCWRHQRFDETGRRLVQRCFTSAFGVPLEGRWIPVHPMTSGFAVNTIFYAAILSALLSALIGGPFALRRLIRRRRGLCPACAYPMGEASVCTECGRALPGTEATT